MKDFTPQKIHHLLVYVVGNVGHELGTVELVKYIYLIDVAYFRLFGTKISGLDYIREVRGPYTRDISNAVSDLELYEIKKTIKPSAGHSVFLKVAHLPGEKPRFSPELTPEEKEIVDRVIKNLKKMNPKDIEKVAYSTEPMRDILNKEKKVGALLPGTEITFEEIQRDPYMLKVLSNRESEVDSEYENEYKKDREEFLAIYGRATN